LLSSLEDLKQYKKKTKSLKGQLLEFEEAQKSREIEISKSVKENKQIIIDLKTRLQEAKRIEDLLIEQLNKKQQDCEKREAEIVLLKKELEKGKNHSRFENSSKILDDNMNSQISPKDKTRLEYYQKSTSATQKADKRQISYANSLKSTLKIENNKKKASLKIVHNKLKSAPPTKEKEYKCNIMAIRNPPKRYQHIFLGYCYSCNHFGHKAVHCKAYGKSYIHRNNKQYKSNKNDPKNTSYNSFSPLQMFNVE
jgi:hypothetical protein